MKKKIIAALMAVILCFAAVFATACGSGNDVPDEPIDVNLPTDIEGSLLVGTKNEVNEIAIMDKLVESFKAKYPNVTVTVEKMNASDYNQTLIQYYNADLSRPGRMPDILEFGGEQPAFISKNIIANLQPYVDASVEAGLLNLDNFYKEMWDSCRVDGTDASDTYMIPRSYDHVVTFINKKVLREAGVDLDPATTKVKNGWTWQDCVDTLQQVRDYWDSHNKSQYYLIDHSFGWEPIFDAIYRSFGGVYFDSENNPTLSTDAFRQGLALMHEFVEKRFIGCSDLAAGNANFEGGVGAMMFMSTVARGRFYDGFESVEGLDGEDLDAVSFPAVGNYQLVGSGSVGYAIYQRSSNKNLAWAFLMHMLTEEAQDKMSESGGVIPIRKDMASLNNTWAQYPYPEMNQAAFVYKPENDRVVSFQLGFDPSIMTDIVKRVSRMSTDILASKYQSKTGTDLQDAIEEVIESCEDDLVTLISDPY